MNNDPLGVRRECSVFSRTIQAGNIPSKYKNKITFISKKLIFFDLLVKGQELSQEICFILKSIIYDFLSCFIAISERRERYVQVNLRSLVEHAARLQLRDVIDESVDKSYITKEKLDLLKSSFGKERWDNMHRVYKEACLFIHSSPKSGMELRTTYLEIKSGDKCIDYKKYCQTMEKTCATVSSIVTEKYGSQIINLFLRTRTELEYLLGKEKVGQIWRLI